MSEGPWELPEGWEWATLKEVVEPVKGKKPAELLKQQTNGAAPYVNIRAFETGQIQEYTTDTNCPRCSEGDVLLVWDGARSGLVGRGINGVVGSTIVVLRPKSVEPDYLFRFLQTKFDEFNSRTRGTGIPHLDPEVVWPTQFPLAPLPEQRRIVAKIEALHSKSRAARDALDRVPGLVKRFRQAVLAKAFRGELTERGLGDEPAKMLLERIQRERRERWEEGLRAKGKDPRKHKYEEPEPVDAEGPRELPEGWVWTTIGELFGVSPGGTPSRNRPEYWGGSVPWVSSGEVAFCRIRETHEKITQEGVENSNAKIHPPGTVLLAMIGEGKTRGQAAILEVPAATNQNVASILCPQTPIPPEYVFWWFFFSYNQTRAQGTGMSEGGAQPALNAEKVRAIPLPLGPFQEQRRIVSRIESLFTHTSSTEAAAREARARLERLDQAVLAKAFRGKL